MILTMKKILFVGFMILLFGFHVIAQVDHDFNPNDRVPAANLKLTKEQIPPVILKALATDFSLEKPETWTKFPYALKEYGWVYDSIGTTNVKPDRYQVSMKTNSGQDLYAVYSADGTLIATREITIDAPIPESVKRKLAKSIYKDWAIVGTREIIRYYHDKKNVEQHFRVTVAKDNVRRTLSFNYLATDKGEFK
jgi:hypothetical protein